MGKSEKISKRQMKQDLQMHGGNFGITNNCKSEPDGAYKMYWIR